MPSALLAIDGSDDEREIMLVGPPRFFHCPCHSRAACAPQRRNECLQSFRPSCARVIRTRFLKSEDAVEATRYSADRVDLLSEATIAVGNWGQSSGSWCLAERGTSAKEQCHCCCK